jgi:hypothetical protein
MARRAKPDNLSSWLRKFPNKDRQRLAIAVLGRALLRALPTNLCNNQFKVRFELRNLDRSVLPNLVAAAHIWRSNFQGEGDPSDFLWSGIFTLDRQSGYNLAVSAAKDLSYSDIQSAESRIVGWGSWVRRDKTQN